MSDDSEAGFTEADDDEAEDTAAKVACKEALRRFFAEGLQPGALLTHAWLRDALGMHDRASVNSFQAFKDWQYMFMMRVTAFQKALLLTHNIALANVFGKGYRVVAPNEQSGWALHEATRGMRKELSKGVSRASHINFDALTLEERQAQSADLNRLKSLREALRRDVAGSKLRARRAAFTDE